MRARGTYRSLALAVAVLALSSRVAWAQPAAVTGLDGAPVSPFGVDASATVLLFTAVDCPISGRYAPEVRRLATRYAAAGVKVWLVYPNAGELPAAVRAHAAAFDYGLPVALDPGGVLADRAEATVTPEVAVFDRAGALAYRGRIDDR
jgi:AhpC/TSA family